MKLLLWLCLMGGLSGQAVAQGYPKIRLTNPGDTPLEKTVVEIPWTTVTRVYPAVDTTQLLLVNASLQQEIPYQLERQGGTTVRNLLVQVSLPANGTVQLQLVKGKPSPVAPKTYCRYVPERYDDFAWENDRVAFRIYGAALNGRSDNAYGTDIWSKRTSNLILNKWYKQNDYHNDHGEGMDYYHVGLTLGAGDFGVFLHDSIGFIHNYRSWEVLDNGPLRSTFRVKFDPYTFDGITVNTTKTYSLDAGSQLSKVQVQLTYTASRVLPVVVGITLRPEPGKVHLDDKQGIIAYWEPQHGKDGTMGVGCIFPNESVKTSERYKHALATFRAKSGEPVVYYTGGAWDGAGLITSDAAWVQYLTQFAAHLKNPVQISAGK